VPDGRYRQAVRLGTGLTVAYVAHGDRCGVPVVLLHAWGESLGCFDRLLPLLPATIHAVAMDQRGHGAADKPAGTGRPSNATTTADLTLPHRAGRTTYPSVSAVPAHRQQHRRVDRAS
jgi:pimeloyl-ACP methyl ester carboxylesterase